MKMKIFLSLVLMNLTISYSYANSPESTGEAKAVMGNVYGAFVKVIPYVYSTTETIGKLKEPKYKNDKDELLKNLHDLSDFFKAARHAEFFQKPGFRPSLETINNHLEETIISVNSNNFLFVQKRLNALTSLCVSCHTQLSDSIAKNAFGDAINKEKRERFESDLAYANYLFLVRRFPESKIYYEKAIESALLKDNALSTNEINNSLRKLITIHTKIKFDYKKAQELLVKYEKDKRLPKLSKAILRDWSKSLVPWKKFDVNSVKSIKEFIAQNLTPMEAKREKIESGEADVTLLISSGVLSNYLTDNPVNDQTADILYWLSIAERRLSSTYFFSLSDLYLKDCIKRFPTNPVARKCYQEYADNLEAGYSGSAGTDIPHEEQVELLKLKSLLK